MSPSCEKPTIDEVRARSREKWGNTTASCWDCETFMASYGWPCPYHCSGLEKLMLDAELDRQLASVGMLNHPFLKGLPSD